MVVGTVAMEFFGGNIDCMKQVLNIMIGGKWLWCQERWWCCWESEQHFELNSNISCLVWDWSHKYSASKMRDEYMSESIQEVGGKKKQRWPADDQWVWWMFGGMQLVCSSGCKALSYAPVAKVETISTHIQLDTCPATCSLYPHAHLKVTLPFLSSSSNSQTFLSGLYL